LSKRGGKNFKLPTFLKFVTLLPSWEVVVA